VLGIEHGAEGTLHRLVAGCGWPVAGQQRGGHSLYCKPTGEGHSRRQQTRWIDDDALALLKLDADRYLVATSRELLAVEHGTSRIAVEGDMCIPELFAHSRFVARTRSGRHRDMDLRLLDTASLPWRISHGRSCTPTAIGSIVWWSWMHIGCLSGWSDMAPPC
jgi:hypothetical protein